MHASMGAEEQDNAPSCVPEMSLAVLESTKKKKE